MTLRDGANYLNLLLVFPLQGVIYLPFRHKMIFTYRLPSIFRKLWPSLVTKEQARGELWSLKLVNGRWFRTHLNKSGAQ